MIRGALLSFGLLALPAVGVARPVRNSFVNRKVANTAQLLAHVRSDRAVLDRYERHFAMARPAVLRYLATLHRGALAKAGYYTIYSVPDDGRLKMHVGRISKGEPMFLDGADRPVLVVKCGNPVVLGPARARRGNPVATVPTATSKERTLDDASDLAAAPSEVLALLPDVPDQAVARTPSAPEAPTAAAMPIVGAGVPPSGLGGLGGFLPLLGGLPVSAAIHHGGGTQSVPEPATLVALGAGAAALAQRRKRA